MCEKTTSPGFSVRRRELGDGTNIDWFGGYQANTKPIYVRNFFTIIRRLDMDSGENIGPIKAQGSRPFESVVMTT